MRDSVKNLQVLFGKEKDGETNQSFYITKQSVAYIMKRPAGGKATDSFQIVLTNGRVFEEETGFEEFLKWLDKP